MDYLVDERAVADCLPDWLLEPPPASPFLTKKQLTADVPFTVRMLYSYTEAKKGSKGLEYEARTSKELPGE